VALARFALVVDGARLVVIARDEVGFIDAPFRTLAGIVGAGVHIVANDGRADASSRIAVVSDSAGVVVNAFGACLQVVQATIFAQAGIHGALVVVVAGIFVDLAIAVVVKAIANVFGR
jgi:hypothetical protein